MPVHAPFRFALAWPLACSAQGAARAIPGAGAGAMGGLGGPIAGHSDCDRGSDVGNPYALRANNAKGRSDVPRPLD